MSELVPEIDAVCQQHGLPKNVFVIDDEWDQRESPDPVAWDEFIQALSLETNTYARFTTSLGSKGYDLSSIPPSDILSDVFVELGNDVPQPVLDAKKLFDDTPHVLKRLETILRNLNFDVKPFATRPDLTTHGIPSLLVVDYHLEPEGSGGDVAKGIFEEIMKFCEEQDSIPPFVILMSQRLPIDGAETVSDVAAASGFFRFRYEFLHKLQLRRSPDAFHLTLLSLLRHTEASKAYFRQLRKLESESARLGKNAARRLMQVTPAEALVFRSRMHREGTSLARVFTDLFREILSQCLSNSKDILQAMGALEDALAKQGIPTVEMTEGGPLHRLYAELVTQSVHDSDVSPPQFGDIYRDESGQLLLILSQECDLASGHGRKPKAERILTLEAEITEQPPFDRAAPQICKPVYLEAEKKHKWLCWSPIRIRLVHYAELCAQRGVSGLCEEPFVGGSPHFVKVFRLRTIDAEHVQQFFASHLTRVGVEPLPELLQHFKGEIRNIDTGGTSQIELYAVADVDGPLVAISPSSVGVFLDDGSGPFLPPSVLAGLLTFTPLSSMIATLKNNNVLLGSDAGKPIFIKPQNKARGTKEWKVPQ